MARRADRRGHEHAMGRAPWLRRRRGDGEGLDSRPAGQGAARLAVHADGPDLRRGESASPGKLSAWASPTSSVADGLRGEARPAPARALAGPMAHVLRHIRRRPWRSPAHLLEGPAPEAQGARRTTARRIAAGSRRDDRPGRTRSGSRASTTDRAGRLCVVEGWSGGRLHFGTAAARERATVTVHSPGVYRRLLGGGVGSGEAYADGQWDADDLTALARIATREIGRSDHLRERLAPVRRPLQRLRGLPALNTAPRRSAQHRRPLRPRQRDVRAVPRPRVDDVFVRVLRDARRHPRAGAARQARARLRAARARPDVHVLEIGTGWGGLALYMARASAAA